MIPYKRWLLVSGAAAALLAGQSGLQASPPRKVQARPVAAELPLKAQPAQPLERAGGKAVSGSPHSKGSA